MESYRHVRCLFCATGKEEGIVQLIHKDELGRAIFPRRMKRMVVDHVWKEQPVPLLPGYVFVFSDEEIPQHERFSQIRNVYRVLTYGDGSEELKGRDLEFADWIWRFDGMIDVMKAVQIGDRVEIVDGAFKQLHGTITKMDRRRKTFRVQLNALGAQCEIWLSYDFIKKDQA